MLKGLHACIKCDHYARWNPLLSDVWELTYLAVKHADPQVCPSLIGCIIRSDMEAVNLQLYS